MRTIERFICNRRYSALELTVYDRKDVRELDLYSDVKTVCTSMEFAPFLSYFHGLENLILTAGQSSPAAKEGVYLQKSIRSLIIDYDNEDSDDCYRINVAEFPNLECVFVRNIKNVQGVQMSASLKTLSVVNYSESDLSMIQGSNLDSLQILRGKVRSLAGIERLPLKMLSLGNIPVKRIDCLNDLKKIQLLEIDRCSKIEDMESLANNSIEYLILLGSQSVSSLDFLFNLPNLKRILLEWTVRSGDLSLLDQLEKAVLFTDKKFYNRKDGDLPKTEKPYDITAVPMWRNIFSDRAL